MKDLSLVISGIEYKVLSVRDKIKAAAARNQQLTKENIELKKIIEEQKNLITRLEEKNKALQIAGSLGKGDGNKTTKLKINELIREVDKCIALLNR